MRSREQGRLICAKDNGGSGAAESTKTLAAPPRVVLFARVRLTIQSPGRTAPGWGPSRPRDRSLLPARPYAPADSPARPARISRTAWPATRCWSGRGAVWASTG